MCAVRMLFSPSSVARDGARGAFEPKEGLRWRREGRNEECWNHLKDLQSPLKVWVPSGKSKVGPGASTPPGENYLSLPC